METININSSDPVILERQTKNNFESDLIDRFFDPKSYYLHGFMTHLKNKEVLLDDPVDTVAIGLMVDDIINSSNKIERLKRLECYDQFNFYEQQLFEGIKYLKSSRLSSQQMMDIVGSLGKSFAETLLELISHQEHRKNLLSMVGLSDEDNRKSEKIEKKVENEVIDSQEISDKVVESDSPEPWLFFKGDVSEKIEQLKKHLEKVEQKPDEIKVFSQIEYDIRDLRDWSMIQGDQGIEAISHKILLLFETVNKNVPDKQYQMLPILKDSLETIHAMNEAGKGSEHLDVVRVMAHQIDQQREIFSNSQSVEEVSSNQHLQYELEDHFENVEQTESDIIAENETNTVVEADNQTEFEFSTDEDQTIQIINDKEESELLTDNKIEKNDKIEFSSSEFDQTDPVESEESIEAEPELEIIDSELESNKLDSEQRKFNFDFKLNDEEKSNKTDNNIDNVEQESFESIRESELLSELVSDNSDNLEELDFSDFEVSETESLDLNSDSELKNISLPGEDDEELLDIISDLKLENDKENNNQKAEDSSIDFQNEISESIDSEKQLNEFEQKNEQDEDLQTNNESNEKVFEDINDSNNLISNAKDGYDFVTEADIYFSFARKALQQLMKNSSEKQALEDMELACYSLKTISNKLDYTQIEKMMEYSERLIQNCISKKIGLKTEHINTLFSTIDELEKAGKDHVLNDSQHQKWLDNQEFLMEKWINETSETQGNVATNSTNEDSEDPLDFLLFDDTSKLSNSWKRIKS